MDKDNNPEQPLPPESQIPIDSGDLQPTPQWARVEGTKEEKKWDTLDELKKKNDERWLKAYGFIVVTITFVFAGIFVLSLIAWTWHYISPLCWHWLDAQQLNKIQSILFSGGMGAIISNIIRVQLGKTH